MHARVKDPWGNILPDSRAAVVRWKTSGELSVSDQPGSAVVISATPTGPQPLPGEVYLIASVDGIEKSDSSTILISTQPESALGDWIAGEYTATALPSFALMSGSSTYGEAVPRTNSLVAFVREGVLDPFACPPTTPQCGTVTIFSPGRAIEQATVAWTAGCDFVSFAPGASVPANCRAVSPAIPTPLPPPVRVPVVIWTLAGKQGIDNQVKADMVYAQSVFDQPLLGLNLVMDVHAYNGKHAPITHGLACKTADGNELTNELSFGITSFDARRITVAYVDAINPSTGDDIGFTCPYDGVNGTGTLIVVSADAINNSTLAHELGHALGQWHSAERDHPDVPPPRLEGFEPSNLMWSSESDWGTSLRRNLTLGQVFQMSLADFSFVKRSQGSGGLHCSTDPASNSPCPPLAKDERQ
jgi:hypothetical protein